MPLYNVTPPVAQHATSEDPKAAPLVGSSDRGDHLTSGCGAWELKLQSATAWFGTLRCRSDLLDLQEECED